LREGNRIVIEPITKSTGAHGSTAGGPSMTDELLNDRRKEEARSKW